MGLFSKVSSKLGEKVLHRKGSHGEAKEVAERPKEAHQDPSAPSPQAQLQSEAQQVRDQHYQQPVEKSKDEITESNASDRLRGHDQQPDQSLAPAQSSHEDATQPHRGESQRATQWPEMVRSDNEGKTPGGAGGPQSTQVESNSALASRRADSDGAAGNGDTYRGTDAKGAEGEGELLGDSAGGGAIEEGKGEDNGPVLRDDDKGDHLAQEGAGHQNTNATNAEEGEGGRSRGGVGVSVGSAAQNAAPERPKFEQQPTLSGYGQDRVNTTGQRPNLDKHISQIPTYDSDDDGK